MYREALFTRAYNESSESEMENSRPADEISEDEIPETVRSQAPYLNLETSENWTKILVEDGAVMINLMPAGGEDHTTFHVEYHHASRHCPYFKVEGSNPITLDDERLPYYMHARIVWSLLRSLADQLWVDLASELGREYSCSLPDCTVKYTKDQRVAGVDWKRDHRPRSRGDETDIVIRGFYVVGGSRKFTFKRGSHVKSNYPRGDLTDASSFQEVSFEAPPGYAVLYFGSLLTKRDAFVPTSDMLSVAFGGLFTDKRSLWNPEIIREAQDLVPFTGPYGEEYLIYNPDLLNLGTVGLVKQMENMLQLSTSSLKWNRRFAQYILKPEPLPLTALLMTKDAEIAYPPYEMSDLEIFFPCGAKEN